MKNAPNISEYLYEIPNTFENTELKQKPFYHTNFKESLEKVVFKNKPGKGSGLVEKISLNYYILLEMKIVKNDFNLEKLYVE